MADALTKAGRYQIVCELGRGSMGVVYEGFDPVIGRTVAVKTMLTEGLTAQECQEFRSRFQREAQAVGALTHPNIVTVYDFGEDDKLLYLAMEYLEGKSLERLTAEQTILPIETIIPIYEQIGSALDHAHKHNIVHRDIKPANIMILDGGLVKIMDFGIAKMMSMGMTQVGQVMGTPNYMSPEQVIGRKVDGRSDIFSLGVILYELVTGEKPFGGQHVTTVIYKIINEDPIPPRELDATIHPGLSYVVCKALAKAPEERYQTCRELTDDLKHFRNLGGQPSPGATVMFKVPPAQFSDAELSDVKNSRPVKATPAERLQPRPAPVQAMPSAKALKEPKTSPMIRALLILIAVAILGDAGYVLLNRWKALRSGQQPGQSVQQATLPVATPAVPASGAPEAPSVTQAAGPAVTQAEPIKSKSETAKEVSLPGTSVAHPGGASRLGQLLISSNVTGARISVDGRSEPNWVTPATITDLPAGTHAIVVSKEGYDDYQQAVTVENRKTKTVNANLSAPRGEIDITTTPPGFEVLIDGRSIGPSPARATVAAGEHRYSIKRAGEEPYENNFTMKSGAILSLKINLGEVVAATGIVEVRTIPPGATVQADGNPVGGQTPTAFRLTAGQHTLVISLPGFRPAREVIEVSPNRTIPLIVGLSR